MGSKFPTKESNVHRLIPASAPLPNPFRAGTKKARCWERFLRGGNSAAILADFRATGCAGTTAYTWLSVFRTFARGMQAAKQGARDERD